MTNELLWALDDARAADDGARRRAHRRGQGVLRGRRLPADDRRRRRAEALPPKGDYADLLLALTRSDKPIVARVNGHAMGGGLGPRRRVALRGRVDARRKLGTPEIDVGLFPMMIMAVLAARRAAAAARSR